MERSSAHGRSWDAPSLFILYSFLIGQGFDHTNFGIFADIRIFTGFEEVLQTGQEATGMH